MSSSWRRSATAGLVSTYRVVARPELLDTYESDRPPVIRELVRMTGRATKVFNSTNPLVHTALTRLAPILLGRSAVQNKAAPKLGQLAAGYRGCPIAKGGGRIGPVSAGDRMPDMRIGGVPLYDMLDLSTLTLFVAQEAGRIAEAYRPWQDILAVRPVSIPGELADGVAWLLVRPDGYLAAVGGSGDTQRLAGWLDRWFIRPAR